MAIDDQSLVFAGTTPAFPNSSSHNEELCMAKVGNKTMLMYDGYGGIPETLAINAIAWIVLILLFCVVRRVAWDYGRIALVSRREENRELHDLKNGGDNKYNVWTSLFYGDHEANKAHGSLESLDTQIHAQDRGFFSWIVAFIRVKDSDIVKKCGQDALQYITFQRYLLLYLTIVCVLSTAIIIPVNFTGNLVGNATDFGHTTIANLGPGSGLLWIHGILSVVYLIVALIFMRHFSVNLKFEDDDQVSKTLMISSIPKDKCFKSVIMQHFHEGYPEIHVEDVQFAYDVEKLMDLDMKRGMAAEARLNSEWELQKTGHRPTLRPYRCGQCLCCGDSCGCNEVDSITYYGDEEETFKSECEKEKAVAYQRPLGVAFVTFENVNMAERIFHDFQPSCKASQNPQPSSVHSELDIVQWGVSYAPSPENIYWSKLSLSGWKWWLKAFLINVAIIILLFFLTTPSMVLANLDRVNYKNYIEKTHSPLLIKFLPTLMLWIFTALLPNIVYYSDQYVGHWTRTSEHHTVMQKTFVFLLLMVLILPSLGLTSAKALFDYFVADNAVDWSCIFLAGNGAFFVNYVITSAFIGSALELLRFSELFMYVLKIILARSSAERTSVRKHIIWEFQYGMEYAWVLCVFATIVSYSISCPLITPFGLVYMALKHIVDRYNIYFAYKPSRISHNIHSTAINMVMIAVVFLQCNFVFFAVVREGEDHPQPISVFSMVVLAFTLVIFFGKVCFGWFRNLGPLSRNKYQLFGDQSSSKMESDSQSYTASVLSDNERNRPAAATAAQSGQSRPSQSGLSATDSLAQSYGTMDTRGTDGRRPDGTDQSGYQDT